MLSWQVKICGITNSVDAEAAVQAGCGALGLNFYPRSLRSVTRDQAEMIVQYLPANISRIGVFVNESTSAINGAVAELGLDAVQLHGDESPEIVTDISCAVIRALRVMDDQFESIPVELRTWTEAGVHAVLLDAGSRREYGGTGRRLNWNAVADLAVGCPLILAGGLNCENVGQAIATARPAAVDVATGVESFPGRKNREQMRRFVALAKQAFASL